MKILLFCVAGHEKPSALHRPFPAFKGVTPAFLPDDIEGKECETTYNLLKTLKEEERRGERREGKWREKCVYLLRKLKYSDDLMMMMMRKMIMMKIGRETVGGREGNV